MSSGPAADPESGHPRPEGDPRLEGEDPRPEGGDKNFKERTENVRKLYVDALDDLVNVNSIFTVAVFEGLSLASPGERSLENRTDCDAGTDKAKRIVVNEVASFACYLLSGLVAKALKIYVTVCQNEDFNFFGNQVLRGSMLLLSVWASVFGCIFLTISIVDMIQIKIGKLSCGSVYAWRATEVLIAIVLLALTIYVAFMMKAMYTSVKNIYKKKNKTG